MKQALLFTLLLVGFATAQPDEAEAPASWRNGFYAEGAHAWMHAIVPLALSIKEGHKFLFMPIIASVELLLYLALAILQLFTGETKQNMNTTWLKFNQWSQIGLWGFFIYHIFWEVFVLFPGLFGIALDTVDPVISYLDISFQVLFVLIYYFAKNGATKYVDLYLNQWSHDDGEILLIEEAANAM